MTRRDTFRSLAVAFIGAIAVVAGLLSLASLPWWATLISSVAVASLALLGDLVFRPTQPAHGRRLTLIVLGAIRLGECLGFCICLRPLQHPNLQSQVRVSPMS